MLMKDFCLMVFSCLVLVIFILVGVAFLTLMERKLLGYIHIRRGPNKLGLFGVFQPFGDAVKLFTKEQSYLKMGNMIIFYFSPVLSLFLSLFIWICMPFFSMNLSFDLSVLFFLSVSSLGVYMVMLAGWSSNSNYAMLGSIRAIAQSISYEVSLVVIFLSFLMMVGSLDLFDFVKFQEYVWFFYLFLPICLMWVVSSLAETNRSPFDFAEGESELVSGFNVEYSSGGFAMIFLAEYSSILFMSMMCVVLFLGADFYSFSFFLKMVFISFFWVWVRGTLPRYRYDKLMYLAWKSYLPSSLNMLMFYISLSLVSLVSTI
uniref:NADH-ubiquinone oxidoreductase chain 1 n=1 Tax=Curculionoidea sp. 20 KM-2017 TaxID=2219404 RepID=A0A346RIR3_9CUCU|nr:NADH dehydrogenase subunit 1 [Curculionoidea sp. 20 KM-2017]